MIKLIFCVNARRDGSALGSRRVDILSYLMGRLHHQCMVNKEKTHISYKEAVL